MTGTLIDTLIAMPRRKRGRAFGGQGAGIRYLNTRAGQLRYVDTRGNKPVLITTPDGPCVIEHYSELIPKLAETFRVICFEMPGTGFSYPSAAYSFTATETSDFMLEIMNTLAVDKAAFAFTCVNAMHATNFAVRFPDRVTHLVLAQIASVAAMRDWTGHNIPAPLRVPYVGQFVGAVTAKTLAVKWFSVSLPRPSEHRAPFTKTALDSIQSGGCFCLSSIVQGAARTPDTDILGATHPTLMIYGDADFSHRHTDFTGLTDTVPQAKMIKYEGCGHFPNLERTNDYTAHLTQFVLGQ